VVHVCHAADSDIDGSANKPVLSQWQPIKMPTAPLIRFELLILDHPSQPYLFESFLNVAEEDQARILAPLVRQDQLYLVYGAELSHRFTKITQHDEQQRLRIEKLVCEAADYWAQSPAECRHSDLAKAKFIRGFV
jgi:hypothetical protein